MYNIPLPLLEQVCANTPNIMVAWLFGSALRGQMHSGSDVDIAILFKVYPSLDERFTLMANLATVVKFAEIDLLVLNRANPLVSFASVSGHCFFCRDHSYRAAYVSLVAREYEDEMGMLELAMAQRQNY